VYANVWGGSERSTVEMRIDGGEWVSMERVVQSDPAYERLVAKSTELEAPYSRLWGDNPSQHLWRAMLPTDLPVGKHAIEVRTTDMHGHTYGGCRAMRVTE